MGFSASLHLGAAWQVRLVGGRLTTGGHRADDPLSHCHPPRGHWCVFGGFLRGFGISFGGLNVILEGFLGSLGRFLRILGVGF